MNLKIATLTVNQAKERLKVNRYSIEAWNILINDALEKNINETRELFDELINVFPQCGKFWKAYITQELKYKKYEHAERLFQLALNNNYPDLWKCYLNYLQETKKNLDDYSTIMTNAYELALEKIGLDVLSFSIWQGYLNHLRDLEPKTESSRERDELIKKIRFKYHEALKTPMLNIELIWQDYVDFENKFNLDNSQQLIEEWNKVFDVIKQVSKEYESVTRKVGRNLPAISPGFSENVEEDLKQMNLWKRYIYWEKQDPLKLSNKFEFLKRINYAFDQLFLCLPYYSDTWYQSSNFFYKQSKIFQDELDNKEKKLSDKERNTLSSLVNECLNKTAEIYDRALSTYMKNNALIHLAYADFEERRKNFTKANEIYEKCLQNQNIEPTLIWIHFIRFVRRTEDILAARKVFKRAREDPRTTYHLIIANANLEYFSTKDKEVGFKIYAIVGKKYSHDAEYMLSYLNYMSHLNEDNNTRVLFERILNSEDLSLQKSHEIWSEFLKFECAVGDLASILKVDKKRQKLFELSQSNNTPGIENINQNTLIIDRYKYLDLYPSNQSELKSMGYKDLSTISNSKTALSSSKSDQQQQQILTTKLPRDHAKLAQLLEQNSTIMQSEQVLAAINDTKKSKYPMPDTMQMLPYKPIRNSLPGMQSLSGGVFPFPQAVTDLVKRLPPPNTFEGPFVIIDDLMRVFQQAELNEDVRPLYVFVNGQQMRSGTDNNSENDYPSTKYHKRGIQHSPNSDDEESKRPSKTIDVYKQRQFKKFIKNPNN